MRVVKKKPLQLRVARRVVTAGVNECWLWRGALRNGYGAVNDGTGRTEYAHRLVYTWTFGEIPAGLFVCHTCDNKRCCNPGHFFLGTPKDNAQDMSRKGRGRNAGWRGSLHPGSKLTEEDVELLRLAAETLPVHQKQLALAWGISESVCSSILLRKSWTHI